VWAKKTEIGKGDDRTKKTDLVDRIHKKLGIPKSEIDTIMEGAFDVIKGALQQEDKIVISKFGAFFVRNKKARRG
jgi:nucleoid DNA-binding protein